MNVQLRQALFGSACKCDGGMYLIIEPNGRSWALMHAAFNQCLEADLIAILRGKITLNISTAKDTAGTLGGAMLVI